MILKPICFLYVFFYNNNKKNITRRTTIWKDRIIVHDIENNPLWCVFLQNKKLHSTRKPLQINRKAESGKAEQYLILKPFSFHQPGSRYQLPKLPNWERKIGTWYYYHSVFTIKIMTELGKTEWYMILMSFCFVFFYDLKTTEWHPNSDPFC